MLSFEFCRMARGVALRGHGHPAPHLMIVTQGNLAERTHGSVHDLTRGSIRLSPGWKRHDLFFGSDGADCLIIEAEGSFWRRVFDRAIQRGDGESVFGVAPATAALLVEVNDANQLASSPTAVAALGRVLAATAPRAPGSAPAWFDDAIDLIERDELCSLARVADTVRRDRAHFTRAFGAWFGFRPAEYRALRRAAAALALVRESDAPFADVALACGYAHQSHMNRAFRSLFGRPPSHWRS